ncbi:MAG TPA: DUF167 domain-containing protein [Blastocatellia bacterium]|nr:DUF167 domain-containing protein [Blastocatellia bacterium]
MEIKEDAFGVTFWVRVQPRASRTEVVGQYGRAIKIRLAAPPVDGRANEECKRFIAELLSVAPAKIEIISGESSRDKLIRVHGVSQVRVSEVLGGD